MTARFDGNFTQQEAVPEAGIERAIEIMRSGRLHRYNVAGDEIAETVYLEQEFAAYMGVEYCLACASGGYALQIALRAFDLSPGEQVLTNAFTLSPVPGAIAAVGARPLLVETTEDLVIDLHDLARKCMSSQARLLLLSHMRGHIVDMDALLDINDAADITVIEDCAHTMGSRWDQAKSGSHGTVACFSTQTYKHINSGEGGLITTRNPQLMARMTVLSGSYMLYERHHNVPGPEIFARVRLHTPNCSGRMDNLRAAVLRPQLQTLDARTEQWNARYRVVTEQLAGQDGLRLPIRPAKEHFVGSSIQFLVDDLDSEQIRSFIARCLQRGVELKWFGESQPVAYTSRHDSWQYIEEQSLPNTGRTLARLCDMRIPLTFSLEDCALIGSIIATCLVEEKEAAKMGGAG